MNIIFSWHFPFFSKIKQKTGSFSRDLEMYQIWWDRNFFHSWNSNNRPQLDQNLCQITSAQNILPNTVSEQFNDKKWPSPKFANTTWFSNDNRLHLSLVKKIELNVKGDLPKKKDEDSLDYHLSRYEVRQKPWRRGETGRKPLSLSIYHFHVNWWYFKAQSSILKS